MLYSIIIPVYNRPEEVAELLDSLSQQEGNIPFEVIIVEDGSTRTCEQAVDAHKGTLPLSYYAKPNTGPGESRNYGAARSRGDYLIVFDSDCIIPARYFEEVERELKVRPCDAFGGPDAAHGTFSKMQKAVNYAMTSFFTTGGIRGGKKRLETFHPRTFNMGIKREAYEALGGFSSMRYGEDIDFSIRLLEHGYSVRLFPHAFVFHKRRTSLRKFFWQVYHSGAARVALYEKHPSSLRAIHFLPALFVPGTLLLAGCSFWRPCSLVPLALFAMLTGIDATVRNTHAGIGCLSVAASFVQLFGYGTGFIVAFIRKII
ncbi:MAG: glycosyltransferase, partial [Prevotellaceae bacterium]|nr:glycosyltransferase [Prevotellaceae bacterium]